MARGSGGGVQTMRLTGARPSFDEYRVILGDGRWQEIDLGRSKTGQTKVKLAASAC
jgi:hypothetical protein